MKATRTSVNTPGKLHIEAYRRKYGLDLSMSDYYLLLVLADTGGFETESFNKFAGLLTPEMVEEGKKIIKELRKSDAPD